MMTEAMLPNEMQNRGSDLTHLNGFLALFDREMILLSWPESSMVIAFLFISLLSQHFFLLLEILLIHYKVAQKNLATTFQGEYVRKIGRGKLTIIRHSFILSVPIF